VKKIFISVAVIVVFAALSCTKKEKNPEPVYVLQRWAKAIEKLDYNSYSKCEAYPKSEGVFLEIYKDDYYNDLMVIDVEEPDNKNIRKDYKGNSYISRKAAFGAAAVKRGRGEPYQTVSGDVEFIKFSDGEKSKFGWLISNRTITRVNK
jgi:hypothetical protein